MGSITLFSFMKEHSETNENSTHQKGTLIFSKGTFIKRNTHQMELIKRNTHYGIGTFIMKLIGILIME